MPGEDEADLVAMVVDGIEQGACATAGDAKDVIDPRLNKHFAHLLAGLHGGLLCAKRCVHGIPSIPQCRVVCISYHRRGTRSSTIAVPTGGAPGDCHTGPPPPDNQDAP